MYYIIFLIYILFVILYKLFITIYYVKWEPIAIHLVIFGISFVKIRVIFGIKSLYKITNKI